MNLQRRIGSGASGFSDVQSLAFDANADAVAAGARRMPLLESIARIGSSGTCPQNAERDGSRLFRRLRVADGWFLEHWTMTVPAKPFRRRATGPPRDLKIQVLLPHEHFAAAYALGDEHWSKVMLGPGAPISK